jgi:TolA-binding protein
MKKTISGMLVVALGLLLIAGCGGLPDTALMEKGKKFEEQEKFAEAIQNYEKIVKKYPKSPLCVESLHRIALIYTNGLQDYPKAVGTYERLIQNYPDSSKFAAQAQFMIGFIYNNYAPDTTKARAAYQKFLAKYPKHELAPSVEWELKYLGKNINEIPDLAKATGQVKESPKKKKK